MTNAHVILSGVQSRDELVFVYHIFAAISERFPDYRHWTEVRQAFIARAKELGLELKE